MRKAKQCTLDEYTRKYHLTQADIDFINDIHITRINTYSWGIEVSGWLTNSKDENDYFIIRQRDNNDNELLYNMVYENNDIRSDKKSISYYDSSFEDKEKLLNCLWYMGYIDKWRVGKEKKTTNESVK